MMGNSTAPLVAALRQEEVALARRIQVIKALLEVYELDHKNAEPSVASPTPVSAEPSRPWYPDLVPKVAAELIRASPCKSVKPGEIVRELERRGYRMRARDKVGKSRSASLILGRRSWFCRSQYGGWTLSELNKLDATPVVARGAIDGSITEGAAPAKTNSDGSVAPDRTAAPEREPDGPASEVVVDAGEDAGEPELEADVMELRDTDPAIEDDGPAEAAFFDDKRPVSAVEGDSSDQTLSGVDVDPRPDVDEVTAERGSEEG